MNIPRIIAKGRFHESDIFIKHSVVSNRKKSQLIESKIDNIWNQKKENAKKSKISIWDSTTYRLNNCDVKNNKLNICLEEISFKIRNSIKEIPELFSLDEDYLGKGCFVSALVKTSDNKYVFGIKRENKMTTIGGVLSKDEIIVKDGYDIFKAMYLELFEEIGMSSKHIKTCKLIGILYSSNGNVGFIFDINLEMSSSEINKFFLRRIDKELSNYKIISEADLKKTLIDMEDYWAEIVNLL